MSHPSAVTAPVQAASKSFHAASLGPLAGLLVGGVALSVALRAYDVEQFLSALGWGEWHTGLELGAATGGALLASWIVGAMARGKRVPVSVLLAITGAVWLVGVALTFSNVSSLFGSGDGMRLAERPGMLSGGMSLAFAPRLIGAFASAGVLLGSALALALSGAAHRATHAVWLGAVGMMVGCVGLSAAAYVQVCDGAGSVLSPLDKLLLLSSGAERLGVLRWAAGATLLACLVLAAGFALLSGRRERVGPRTALGAVGAFLIPFVSVGADRVVGTLSDRMLASEWKLRSVPAGFAPVQLPGANAFPLTAENTRPAAIHDAHFVVVPAEARFSEEERFPGSVLLRGEALETDEGLQRLKGRLGEALPEAMERAAREEKRTGKPTAPAVSVAVDARVPMSTLARVIAVAHQAGAEGLFFVGRSADHDDPAVRDTLRTHAPSLEPVLDAPLGVSTWFAPPADARASERLMLRARVTGAGAFEVSPLKGEDPRFQVDPARQTFPGSQGPDAALGVAPEGPAPVVLLSVSSAPEVSAFLEAAAALRARGFVVVLER